MKRLKLWCYTLKDFFVELCSDGEVFTNIILITLNIILFVLSGTVLFIAINSIGIFYFVLGVIGLIIISHVGKFLTVYFTSKNNEVSKINHSIFKQMTKIVENNFVYQPFYKSSWILENDTLKNIDCYYKNKPIQLTLLDFYRVFRECQKENLEKSLEKYIKKESKRNNEKKNKRIKSKTATKDLLDEMIKDIQEVKNTMDTMNTTDIMDGDT